MSYREPVTPLATGGEWGYDPGDPDHSGSREEPPDPGYPPFVYAVVTDPDTGTEHDVPIAVMDFPVYEDEPDPLDQHDESVRQEGYPQENARLFSLTPANIRAMPEALACCRDGDQEVAAPDARRRARERGRRRQPERPAPGFPDAGRTDGEDS